MRRHQNRNVVSTIRSFVSALQPLAILCTLLFCGLPLWSQVRTTTSSDGAIDETPISQSDRDHWAFQPVRAPSIPVATSEMSTENPIDAFIAIELHKAGLTLAPRTDRNTWIRRVTLTLTGLPPTTDEVQSYLDDSSPDADERVVDRLLASPRYGEHMALYWLDLASFADTDGFEHDKLRANAWQYRDWVIEAYNHDLPFDQFVREQLGATSQPFESNIATMFCLAGPDMPDVNDQMERRHFRLNELTSTIGATLLGLQMGCASCHDHKYDPISQADFYRLRAVFEHAVAPMRRDVPNVVLQENSEAESRFWIRGDHRQPGPLVAPAFPRVASYGDNSADPKHVRESFVDWLVSPDNTLFARVAVNRIWQQHFGRGLFESPSDVGVMNAGPTNAALLDWLASDLRNSGWTQKRLHRMIVLSSTFGQSGRSEEGADSKLRWSFRLQKDPGNRLWSRFGRIRMTGEMIRDSMLDVSGLLTSKVNGPSVSPPIPTELVETLLKDQWIVTPNKSEHYRRSIFLFARRNLRYPLFEAFDRPDAISSCPQRARSTTATQSLVMLNGELSRLVAEALALRLQTMGASTQEQIVALVELGYGRSATESETNALTEFVRARTSEWEQLSSQGTQEIIPSTESHHLAMIEVCLAVLNSNEFIFYD